MYSSWCDNSFSLTKKISLSLIWWLCLVASYWWKQLIEKVICFWFDQLAYHLLFLLFLSGRPLLYFPYHSRSNFSALRLRLHMCARLRKSCMLQVHVHTYMAESLIRGIIHVSRKGAIGIFRSMCWLMYRAHHPRDNAVFILLILSQFRKAQLRHA